MSKKKKGILATIFSALFGSGRSKSKHKRKSVSKRKKPSKKRTTRTKIPYQERTDSKAKKPLIQKFVSLLNKQKKEKQKIYPKNEFRFNHKTGHMNYVFGESESDYKSVGLTTKEFTFGKKNMQLKVNPKNGDLSEESYIRNGIISDRKESFSGKPAKNFKFSKDDKANVKSKIRHYKKEQKK